MRPGGIPVWVARTLGPRAFGVDGGRSAMRANIAHMMDPLSSLHQRGVGPPNGALPNDATTTLGVVVVDGRLCGHDDKGEWAAAKRLKRYQVSAYGSVRHSRQGFRKCNVAVTCIGLMHPLSPTDHWNSKHPLTIRTYCQ